MLLHQLKRWVKKVALFRALSEPQQNAWINSPFLPYMFIAFSFILIHCHSFKMVEFSIPSSFEPTQPLQHAHTPKKAAVLETLSYLQDHHIRVWKEDVFHYFNVSRRTRFCWTAENKPRRLHNHPDSGPDPCGRPRKLTRDDLRKMEDVLMSGFHGWILNWQQLATAAGIAGVSYCTIHQHMQDLDYHSCIECMKFIEVSL